MSENHRDTNSTTIQCPYPPDTREAFAYWCGRDGQIPPPQIVMDDELSDAWDRGMDDRAALRELANHD